MRMLRFGTRILAGAFIWSLALSAQTFTTLYTFSGTDGNVQLYGSLVLGAGGELYGTATSEDGTGEVYELLPPATSGGAWTKVVIHSFVAQDGGPLGSVTMGPNGSLYGAAVLSVSTGGYSLAFRLDPPTGTSTQWPYSVIYQGEGVVYGGMVFGSPLGGAQSLYGVTGNAVYRLSPPPAGGAWTYKTLYTLPVDDVDGGQIGLPLAVGAAGTIFGVTGDGGYVGGFCFDYEGCGTAFSLTPPATAGGPWTEGILHAFNPGAGDGYRPIGGLVIGPGGVLYGTTSAGGAGYEEGGGTVFSLTSPAVAGAPVTETILYPFGVAEGAGCQPETPLVLGPSGVLYGTTLGCGAGTIFQLAPPPSAGGAWTLTTLYSFAGSGYSEPAALTLGPEGTLYGVARDGSGGIVFALTP
jgi:hypothetical protein